MPGSMSWLNAWSKGPGKERKPNPRNGVKSLDPDYSGVCVLRLKSPSGGQAEMDSEGGKGTRLDSEDTGAHHAPGTAGLWAPRAYRWPCAGRGHMGKPW